MSSRPYEPQIRTSRRADGPPLRVALVVFDGVTLLDLSGPSEVLHQADRFGHPYELTPVPPGGGPVTTAGRDRP
ncbi:hypothetical protein [Streptomyces sp. NPDC002067]